MEKYTSEKIFNILKNNLIQQIEKHNLSDERIEIKFHSLSTEEAIGNTTDKDYPIISGKEKMIEARFRDSKGQAFTDEYGDHSCSINDLLKLPLTSNNNRSIFIAALNAIYRSLNICDKTVHCKDQDPVDCGAQLLTQINPEHKILLVGLQPRMLQNLAARQKVRVIDLDQDNIGQKKFGVLVESDSSTKDAIEWCDSLLVTGTTIINSTIPTFLNHNKQVIFFGVTISAAAQILNLKTYCSHGN